MVFFFAIGGAVVALVVYAFYMFKSASAESPPKPQENVQADAPVPVDSVMTSSELATAAPVGSGADLVTMPILPPPPVKKPKKKGLSKKGSKKRKSKKGSEKEGSTSDLVPVVVDANLVSDIASAPPADGPAPTNDNSVTAMDVPASAVAGDEHAPRSKKSKKSKKGGSRKSSKGRKHKKKTTEAAVPPTDGAVAAADALVPMPDAVVPPADDAQPPALVDGAPSNEAKLVPLNDVTPDNAPASKPNSKKKKKSGSKKSQKGAKGGSKSLHLDPPATPPTTPPSDNYYHPN